MDHTKKSHPVVGLIILIVLGYLVYHVAYLAVPVTTLTVVAIKHAHCMITAAACVREVRL